MPATTVATNNQGQSFAPFQGTNSQPCKGKAKVIPITWIFWVYPSALPDTECVKVILEGIRDVVNIG